VFKRQLFTRIIFFNRLNKTTMQKLDQMNVKFIIRKNREVGGFVPIQMQITFEAVRLFITAGQKIEVEYWDVRSGMVIGKIQKIKVINEHLNKM
jgi:hypothetical protein